MNSSEETRTANHNYVTSDVITGHKTPSKTTTHHKNNQRHFLNIFTPLMRIYLIGLFFTWAQKKILPTSLDVNLLKPSGLVTYHQVLH